MSVMESTKSMVTNSDQNLQQASTKDSILTEENTIMTLTKHLSSLKYAVIESIIKYVLYLLCFYLFDAISSRFLGSKEHIKAKHDKPYNEDHDEDHDEDHEDRRKKINQKCKRRNNYSNGRRLRKPQNAEEASDSSRNQSSDGSNVTAKNMPSNIDSCILYAALKKPMYISTGKHSFNKTQFPINISQDNEPLANERSNVIQNKFSKSHIPKQRSNFSGNKGIAGIYSKKFTSSDNMHSSSSFHRSSASYRYRKSKRTDFFYNGENSKFSNNSLIKPGLKKNETEPKMELFIKFASTNEKKKLTFDKKKKEKHTEQRNRKKTQEKHSFRQHGPTKYKSYYSRVPLGNKESKQNNLKYEEKDTQTDSVFPTHNDVKMVSVGTMWPEQQFYESQDRDMNQKLTANNEYVADDEIMDEKMLALAQQLISSYVISPTSRDLTFDKRIFELPNINTAAELNSKKLSNSINTFKTPTHAPPPGFSNVPQYPPLTLDIPNPEHLMRPSSTNVYDSNSRTN